MSEEATQQGAPSSEPAERQLKILKKIFDDLIGLRRLERLHAVYANYVNFEISGLDLKILFGQLNQPGAKANVDWHTAVTMAWPQAKIITYFLRVNLAIYEAAREIIKLPAAMLPATPTLPEDIETNPPSKKVFEAVQIFPIIRFSHQSYQCKLFSTFFNPTQPFPLSSLRPAPEPLPSKTLRPPPKIKSETTPAHPATNRHSGGRPRFSASAQPI